MTGAATYPADSLLNQAQGWKLAQLALSCIEQEYPNKLDHVMGSTAEVLSPAKLHPAFFGCYDWHSSVHGHWLLVKVLKLFPTLPEAGRIRDALARRLTPENINSEVAYLKQTNRASFERPYGWAWLLKLSEELHSWNDPQGQKWANNLKPLTDAIVNAYLQFFPKQTYPIRTGVHPNSAFALAFAWDYAQAVNHVELRRLCEERARTYYMNDCNCPASWEPGGEDFFSPCLMEAELMRRVMGEEEFIVWWKDFLDHKQLETLFIPALVSDRSDPKIAHLDGLNYSRAWCLSGIAGSLSSGQQELFEKSARNLILASLPHLTAEQYEGSHWLGTFALYSLSDSGMLDK